MEKSKSLLLLKLVCLFIGISLVQVSAIGQELPRSVSFGAQVVNIDDSTKTALKLPSVSGTRIIRIIDGSSAKDAGFAMNDVLISIDEKKIENTPHFISLLREYNGGNTVKISFYRNGKMTTKSVLLKSKPKENRNNSDLIYSSILSGKNHLRTIVTKPKGNGNYPAVLIVGGVGCYSIDNISGNDLNATNMWIDSLTANGFVTLRVEKNGIGDSKGVPCQTCDFITETQGFLDGLKQLKSLSYVDKENVFIAGFSMGGLIGPLIAQEEPVKGIIVYGTAGRNWVEYELENTHRQRLLENYPADSLDLWMRAEYIRLYGLFVEKKNPEQIMAEHPETTPTFFKYPMSIEYFQQVSDVNIRELWKKTNSYVLAMHGSTDYISSKKEHKLIVDIVNQYHPNQATFVGIENSDHWELFTENEMISKLHTSTALNPAAVTTAINWIKDILKG